MTVTLISCFRNSVRKGHIPRFFAQVAVLDGVLRAEGHELEVICSEGDSEDNTLDQLSLIAAHSHFGVTIVNGSHGGPEMGSVTDPKRMAQFAHAANAGLAAVDHGHDVAVYVESDLIWQPEALRLLMHDLEDPHVDVVAPMVFAGLANYDLFSHRYPGKGAFSMQPVPPYDEAYVPGELNEMDSVGSCLVMRGEVARLCRMQPEDSIVGFCREARDWGFRIWLNPRIVINHPV